ncbi:MAG TPA: hypothetical protein VHT29_04755 [Solirubrobacteraceae bacterium]|nr:hypothetical protein [Solirubrobacteraceae bacterium]
MSAAIAIVLLHGPVSTLGSNGVLVNGEAYTNGPLENCQGGGTLPRGTTAVRVSLLANVGPSIGVRVISSSSVLTTGRRGSGWGTDASVTVPVKEVRASAPDTVACVSIGHAAETIGLKGAVVEKASGKRELWLRVEYLRPARASWLSLASSIAGEFNPVRTPGGTGAALLAIALMLAAAGLAARVILREVDRSEM